MITVSTLPEYAAQLEDIAAGIRSKAEKQATLTRGPLEDHAKEIERIARGLPAMETQCRGDSLHDG